MVYALWLDFADFSSALFETSTLMSCTFAESLLASVTLVVLFALRAFFKRFGLRSRSQQLFSSLLATRVATLGPPTPPVHSTPQYSAREFVEVDI